ncbi:MAG: hypothetical protein KAH99_02805 [Verrucomicrobia bacterium]|nr:hypothetical protein [Verrucomicrobiota bacterium]
MAAKEIYYGNKPIRYGLPSGGSLQTIGFVRKIKKSYEQIDLLRTSRERAVKTISEWLNGEGEDDYGTYVATPPESCVLHVAGNRESKAPDIELLVQQIMIDVLRTVNPECEGFYPLA